MICEAALRKERWPAGPRCPPIEFGNSGRSDEVLGLRVVPCPGKIDFEAMFRGLQVFIENDWVTKVFASRGCRIC